jgi:hypothetical protein
MLRSQILRNVKEEKFITYTGDPAERMALSAFRLNPIKAARFAGSASAVKEMLYRQAITESEQAWRDKVPAGVADLIECNWVIVKRFARSSDNTLKVLGMKIPKEGFI